MDFDQIKQHYYRVQDDINPTGIVPKGPLLEEWAAPHDRDRLGGRPFGTGTPARAGCGRARRFRWRTARRWRFSSVLG